MYECVGMYISLYSHSECSDWTCYTPRGGWLNPGGVSGLLHQAQADLLYVGCGNGWVNSREKGLKSTTQEAKVCGERKIFTR